MNTENNERFCKGSVRLGSGCKTCSRCLAEIVNLPVPEIRSRVNDLTPIPFNICKICHCDIHEGTGGLDEYNNAMHINCHTELNFKTRKLIALRTIPGLIDKNEIFVEIRLNLFRSEKWEGEGDSGLNIDWLKSRGFLENTFREIT